MPTFSWVQEDAWERMLSALDRAPDPAQPRPPVLHCPFCREFFTDVGLLQEHIASSHHVARPAMLIDGQEPAHGFVIRNAPRAADISFTNTTSVELSIDNEAPKAITEKQVWAVLAKTPMARVRLELKNTPVKKVAPMNWQAAAGKLGDVGLSQSRERADGATPEPVETCYDFTIRIATAGQLLAVENAFSEHLNVPSFSRDSVDAFLCDPRCRGVAEDYATGMAEYALGVLTKEGRNLAETGTPLSRYRDHFGSALVKLAPHQRALPRLLSALMRFSLNIFSHAGEATGHVGLDTATATLVGPKAPAPKASTPAAGSLRIVCPIDHGTDRILRLADDLFSATRWSAVLNDECRQVANAAALDLVDQDKAAALWALAALHHKATGDAIEPLQRIAGTYPFADWVSPTLDAVTA